MPRATMSPQVPQPHPYSQTPTPPQQHQHLHRPPPYGTPGSGPMGPNPPQQYGGGAPTPNMMPQGARPQNLTGYATVMPEVQQRQVMEQARARADAEQRVSGHMGKMTQGEVMGLAGIGLGGSVDVHKIAAAKAMQQHQHGSNGMASPSPKMPMHGGHPSPSPGPMNGGGPVMGGGGGGAMQPLAQMPPGQVRITSASPVPIPMPGGGQGFNKPPS